MTSGLSRYDGSKHQYKELMSRHQDMQQNKDKVEGTLISILLLTQITELKMLVDIGRQGHRLYDVVLALLVASIGALILVGLIVLYVGNLRYYRRRRKTAAMATSRCCHPGETNCFGRCSSCCIKRRQGPVSVAAVATSRGSRLTDSYVCVPLGVSSATDGDRSVDHIGGRIASETRLDTGESTANLSAVRCSAVSGWPDDVETLGGRREPMAADAAMIEFGCNRFDLLDSAVEEARSRLAAINARLALLKADHDTRGLTKKSDTRVAAATSRQYDESGDTDAVLAACQRQKEAAEADLAALEARRERDLAEQRLVNEVEERAVLRAVTFWQHFTIYVLYFVCLMNIFITAFGIYNSSSGSSSGFGMTTSDAFGSP